MSFDLRSIPDPKGRPRLYLMQLPFKTTNLPPVDVPVTLAALEGPMLEAARPALASAVGAKTIEDFLSADRSFVVDEDTGVRFVLLFSVLSGQRMSDRIPVLVRGVMQQSPADAVLYFNKLQRANDMAKEKGDRARASVIGMIEVDGE